MDTSREIKIQIDLKSLANHRRIHQLKSQLYDGVKKKASYAVLVATVLCAIGPTISICANDANTDVLKEGKSGSTLNTQQGADMLTLQTFQTSPFATAGSGQAGYIEHKQTFEELARDLSIEKNYKIFRESATKVLKSTNLCSGSGDVEKILQDCANTRPDEFASASNMVRSYFEWQNSELSTVIQYYTNKLTSPVLRDRIEGRLVASCLREQLTSKDSTAAYDYCRKPSNWSIKKTFYATCSNGSDSSTDHSTFDYKNYVQTCVLNSVVKDSLGSTLYLDMIPNFSIAVDGTGLTIRTTPFTETPATLYHLIYDQTYGQLSSGWFQKFATQGCLPSVFAPKDFADRVLSQDGTAANYYSICLPQRLMESINALPKIDQEFFNAVIAKRIATIQVIELLNGSTLIAEETHRNLMAADREIGTLVESYPRYMSAVEHMYKEQIDLVHGKKLDDVLEKIESLMESYSKEASGAHRGQQDTVEELIRLKNHRATGE